MFECSLEHDDLKLWMRCGALTWAVGSNALSSAGPDITFLINFYAIWDATVGCCKDSPVLQEAAVPASQMQMDRPCLVSGSITSIAIHVASCEGPSVAGHRSLAW